MEKATDPDVDIGATSDIVRLPKEKRWRTMLNNAELSRILKRS
jgi:hypothetical protein